MADIIAAAVSNIIANQEVQLREDQKSHLLQISEHIATIRDKDDLFYLITEEIKSFVPFDDMAIAELDEEKRTFCVFLSNMGETTKEHKSYQPSITQVHPLVKGTVPYKTYATEKPFIIDVEEEYRKDSSDYLRYAYEFGMKQELVGRLVHSGKVIGLLAMLSKTHRYTENEKELILKTLKYTRGKIRGKDGAAELLDILPTTLEARMKKLGTKKEFIVQ